MQPEEPFAAPAPSFAAPLDMLHACHDKVRRFAGWLDALPAWLEQHGCNDGAVSAAQGIVRYFDIAGPLHHDDEERDLFPLLLARDPSLADEIAALKAEHRAFAGQWAQLKPQLEAVAARQTDTLDATLAHAFAGHYREHAAREEGGVFAQAAVLLSAAELAAIGEPMQARRRS